MSGVWSRLHSLFDTDDGSLPEVLVTELTSSGVAAVYAFIRSQAKAVSGRAFWHRTLDREERLDLWPNAAFLVAIEEAEPFHVLASGLTFDGVTIPDLGVFIFQEEVALDYRMGKEWDEAHVLALFELLRRLATLDPHAQVRLERGILPEVEKAFLEEWSAYCQRNSASG